MQTIEKIIVVILAIWVTAWFVIDVMRGWPVNMTKNYSKIAIHDDHYHQKAERVYWIFSLIFGMITVVAAVAAAFIAGQALQSSQEAVRKAGEQVEQAKEQTKIARDAYVTTTRAWVETSIDPGDIKIFWNEKNDAIVTAGGSARNVGNSPAIQVNFVVYAAVNAHWRANETEVVRNTCLSNTYGPGIGTVLVHDAVLSNQGISTVSFQQIENRHSSNQIVSPDHTQEYLSFWLISCAIYKIVSDGVWHHTAHVFEVGEMSPDGLERRYIRVGNPIFPGHTWISKSSTGDYAD